MSAIESTDAANESASLSLGRSDGKNEQSKMSFIEIANIVYLAPFFLLIVAANILVIGGLIWLFGSSLWFVGSSTFETLTTGTMPTGLLSLVKEYAEYFMGLGLLGGLYLVWKGTRVGWEKAFAIVATVLLFIGFYSVHDWSHNGRGAVVETEAE